MKFAIRRRKTVPILFLFFALVLAAGGWLLLGDEGGDFPQGIPGLEQRVYKQTPQGELKI